MGKKGRVRIERSGKKQCIHLGICVHACIALESESLIDSVVFSFGVSTSALAFVLVMR